MKRRPIRKRSFLLVELLVALALVTLLAIPLLRPHLGALHQEMELLREMQLELGAQRALAQVQEKMYRHEITWEEIQGGGTRPRPATGQLPDLCLHLPKGEERLPCTYHVWQVIRTPKGKAESGQGARAWYRINKVEILFDPDHPKEEHLFTFHLFSERLREGERQPF
jgi:hypothetical protein